MAERQQDLGKTPDQPQKPSPFDEGLTTPEDPLRRHTVDRLTFRVYQNRIDAIGWQGRHGWQGRQLMFLPDELDVMKTLMGQIPTDIDPEAQGQHSSVALQKGEDEQATFHMFQENGWVELTRQEHHHHLEFANADVPALLHVFDEFDKLRGGDDPDAEHSCEEFDPDDEEGPKDSFAFLRDEPDLYNEADVEPIEHPKGTRRGDAFAWLKDEPDLYTLEDGEPVNRERPQSLQKRVERAKEDLGTAKLADDYEPFRSDQDLLGHDPAAVEFLRKGNAAWNEGRREEAGKLYDEALARDPSLLAEAVLPDDDTEVRLRPKEQIEQVKESLGTAEVAEDYHPFRGNPEDQEDRT